MHTSDNCLRQRALSLLQECDPHTKAAGVARLAQDWLDGRVGVDESRELSAAAAVPGRPARPELVPPRLVGRRSMVTQEGRAMLIHALAHIEFNAINLALDAVWRFPGMPHEYYADWLRVAKEEAGHFILLSEHLEVLGFAYGDFPGHDSLWEMVGKTTGDVLARMALVPRTMEARGLDAIPPLRAKLKQAGDARAAEILDILLQDEIGHVEIGNRWFFHLCQQRGLAPMRAFAELARQYEAPVMRGPFNIEARRKAGFTEEELAQLQGSGLAADALVDVVDSHQGR